MIEGFLKKILARVLIYMNDCVYCKRKRALYSRTLRDRLPMKSNRPIVTESGSRCLNLLLGLEGTLVSTKHRPWQFGQEQEVVVR